MLEQHYLLPHLGVEHSVLITKGVLTASEVGQILRIHPTTVYRLVHEGKFPIAHFMIGADYRFPKDEVLRWIESASARGVDEARSKRQRLLARRKAGKS